MSISRVIELTDFNWFYTKYKPLTPYGIDHKERYHFISTKSELEHIHLMTNKMVEFIQSDETSIVKVEHHLSRIDRLNDLDKVEFDSADLFLIKKFLINYKAIYSYFNTTLNNCIEMRFSSLQLLEELAPDNDFSESFYLSSAFDTELDSIRKKIANLNTQLSKIKQSTIVTLLKHYQLDFNNREFILVDKSILNTLDPSDLVMEFYDSHMLRVKPVFPNSYMDGLIQKEEHLNVEAELEKKILKLLSEKISKEKHELKRYISDIEQIDVLIAKARIALRYDLIKPEFDNKTLAVKNGVFLPLQLKHQELGLKYKPLTALFDSNSILLSGSNMGGKTILFKTIGFLQLLSQMGFFVPAQKFQTQIVDEIHVLGINGLHNVEGLSSFGQEIHNLSSVITKKCPMLLLVDELAKTTNATEAKAILYAVLKHVTLNKNITGFFSTHFINMPEVEGVSKYRMKGLNKSEYLNYCEQNTEQNISKKIKLINTFMQYEVEKDDKKSNQFDALTIAGLLGLSNEILKHANDYLETKYD